MKNEKAVAVAKDVLAKLHSIKIYMNRYITIDRKRQFNTKSKKDMRLYSAVIRKNCGVCVLGACLLSKAELYGNFSVAKLFELEKRPWEIREELTDIFSTDTANSIEAAFTVDAFKHMKDTKTELIQNAICFGRKYLRPRQRLRAIMENIIVNGGEFVVVSEEKSNEE